MRFIANKNLKGLCQSVINPLKEYSSNRELGFTIFGVVLFIFLAVLKIAINSSIFGREIGINDYYDVNVYYNYITIMKTGSLPYIDFTVEYPVLFGIFLLFLSSIPYTHFWDFVILYILITFLLFILTQIVLFGIQKNMKLNELYSIKLIIIWNISMTSIVLLVLRYEIIPILLTCCVIYFFQKYKETSNESFMHLAVIFTIIGFNFKWFPIFMLPILILESKNVRIQLKRFIISILVTILINLPFLLLNFQGWFDSYLFHFNRSPNTDSFHHLLLEIFGPGYGFLQILLVLLGIIIGLVTIFKLRKVEIDLTVLLSSYVFFCLLFFVFNKVFSPQFLLWILPVFIFLEWNRIFLLIPILDFLNIIVFKTDVIHGLFVANIVIRQIILVIFLIYVARKYFFGKISKKELTLS
ncbi:MAG: hypothetical protein ACW981_00990 [Candidatus Hodarchaeales archaeon]|jgi:hypothetical protein